MSGYKNLIYSQRMEVKMKKKVMLMVVCAVLLLIFTSFSYGWGPDPKPNRYPPATIGADPWSDPIKFPSGNTITVNVIILSISPNPLLTFTINGLKSSNGNIDQSNINREKWLAPKDSTNRLPQR